MLVSDAHGAPVAGAGRAADADGGVLCEDVESDTLNRYEIDLGDSDDRLTVDAPLTGGTACGGAGADRLEGDLGADDVPGLGADEIQARDGEADAIACGIGPDRVVADARDTADLACESVERPAAAPLPGPAPAADPLKLPARLSLRALLRHGLRVEYTCPARCVLEARLTHKGTRVARAKGRTHLTLRVPRRAARACGGCAAPR